MKLLLLLIFFTGCAMQCPSPKPKELTYLERIEQQNLYYIDVKIDKIEKLKKEEKEIMKVFVRCVRQMIPNYHTVNNLMEWQKKTIHMWAEETCNKLIEKEMEKM